MVDEDDRKDGAGAEDKALGELLRAHATRHRASPALGAAIRAEIALQAASARAPARAPRHRWPAWGLAGLGFACGVAATSAVLLLGDGRAGGAGEEVVASHVRALMAEHLTDIASTNQHQVKPWFQGRLDYAPPVRDFATEGYALAGGRLDYVGGRAVAALIYRHRDHLINLFVWPAASEQAPQKIVHQGYNLVSWRHGGMQYWLVSDLNAGELEALQALLE